MTGDLRPPRALRVALQRLEEAGVTGCGAEAAGPRGEVLLLTIPAGQEHRLSGEEGSVLRARLRDAGFRYVAVDLAPERA